MRLLLAGWILLLLLGGCATRGSLDFACPEFETLRHDLPQSRLEREIHGLPAPAFAAPTAARSGDAPGNRAMAAAAPVVPASDDLAERMARVMAPGQRARSIGPATSAPPAVLLLSGGGQWGAFGAGFLDQLRRDGDLPNFTFITGVSTGALQSLFVAIGTPEAYDALLEAYAPARESEVVDRNPEWQALLRGSIAGLKPLRRRVEAALCPDAILGDPSRLCALDALKALRGRKSVLIGFVQARTGAFQYVDAVDVAQLPRERARTCLSGAAIASAAMPVFFQQVRINGETYYDGGVRQSVFEASIAASAETAAELAGDASAPSPGPAAPPREPLLPIYVVRNGPTTVEPDDDVDTNGDALTAALRAEAIVVNQLEVGSIASIRIEHPTGRLLLVTADGWQAPGCVKPKGAMFDPAFMACLTRYGRAKAASSQPWIDLSPLPLQGRTD